MFIRTLRNKIYIYVISVSKDVYIDKLDNIANKYNSTYIDFGKKNSDEDPKLKVGDHVRISKYKQHLCKRLP